MALRLPRGICEYYGRNVDKIPKLLKDGKIPISAARFIQSRLKYGDEFSDLWTYTDTSDLVVYPKGDSKNIYTLLTVDNQNRITDNGKRALELIKSDNLASNYGAVVEQLDDLKGKNLIKIPKNRIITGQYFTQKQVLDELVWRVLTRHPDEVPAEFAEDRDLLREYFSEVALRTKNPENMALFIENSLKDKTTLKAWCVCRLGNRSGANGGGDLGGGYGRFLGLAPEALLRAKRRRWLRAKFKSHILKVIVNK